MKKYRLWTLALGSIAFLAVGCVERRVVYVPAPPGATAAPVVADQAPPTPQVEVVPVAPGPEYVWTPGCWSWGARGWVWVGGRYVVRPHPHAVWVQGHWTRHGRGYVWMGGRWR